MEIGVITGDITALEVDAIIVNLFEGIKRPGGATGAVDVALDGAITRLIEDGEITGKRSEMTLIHTLGMMPTPRVVVAGLGKQERFSAEGIRQVMGEAGRFIRKPGVRRAVMACAISVRRIT